MTLQSLPTCLQVVLLLAPALIAACAVGGIYLNILQYRAWGAQARATLVADCLKGFALDAEMQNAYYAIESESLRFDDEFAHSARQRELDRLLRHFANIALAWRAGLLTVVDVRGLEYYILRITQNAEVRSYIEFVVVVAAQVSPNEHPFSVLDRLGRELIRTQPTRRRAGRAAAAAAAAQDPRAEVARETDPARSHPGSYNA